MILCFSSLFCLSDDLNSAGSDLTGFVESVFQCISKTFHLLNTKSK
jgi:hypothetical protein